MNNMLHSSSPQPAWVRIIVITVWYSVLVIAMFFVFILWACNHYWCFEFHFWQWWKSWLNWSVIYLFLTNLHSGNRFWCTVEIIGFWSLCNWILLVHYVFFMLMLWSMYADHNIFTNLWILYAGWAQYGWAIIEAAITFTNWCVNALW